jgi:hypothetical protein
MMGKPLMPGVHAGGQCARVRRHCRFAHERAIE